MNIKKLEDVLAEMRRACFADEAQLRAWEDRIAEAITDNLMAQIGAAVGTAALASEPGGHDWDE
jgi:hypothetical protein